jgi:hypothetical protein
MRSAWVHKGEEFNVSKCGPVEATKRTSERRAHALVLPKTLEPVWRQYGVAHRRLDRSVSEIGLDCASVLTIGSTPSLWTRGEGIGSALSFVQDA